MLGAIAEAKIDAPSWAAYAAALRRAGARTVEGGAGTLWIRYQRAAMMRMPPVVGAPSAAELGRVLWRGRAALASYLLEPDDEHPANAVLYVCRDRAYALDRLSAAARRNVRRAQRELTVAPVGAEELMTHGAVAFCETRQRLGLSDGTPGEFARRFGRWLHNPSHLVLGAWKGGTLAAFLSITEVADYAEIEGSFTADAFRALSVSDLLWYAALRRSLVERGATVVSCGLSSVQADSNAVGLHQFKCRVGFVAEPVHRAFTAHPLIRPLIRRPTLAALQVALRVRPRNPHLRKAAGVVACMLGDARDVSALDG